MRIGYGGGIVLPLYPIVSPNQKIIDSINTSKPFIASPQSEYINITFKPEFIDSFITMWRERIPPDMDHNINLMKQIMENSYFECKLSESGYFDAFFIINSTETYNIYKNEICIDDSIREGFEIEMSTHFKDIYSVIFAHTHTHVYTNFHELLSSFILTRETDTLILKNQTFSDINAALNENQIKSVMEYMDKFENEIRRLEFIDFFFDDVLTPFNFYYHISERKIYIRNIIWSLRYIQASLNGDLLNLQKVKELSHDLDSFSNLLSLRKEIIDTIKSILAYYVSFVSIVIGLLGVMATLLYQQSNVYLFYGSLLFLSGALIYLLHATYKAISFECMVEYTIER